MTDWTRPTYSYGRKGLWRGHATVHTTDDTETEIATFRLHPGETANVVASCIVQNKTGSAYAMYNVRGAFRNSGGTLSQIDDMYHDATYESDSNLKFDITADDTNDTIDFKVTGISATDYYWVADIEILLNRGDK